MLLLPRYFRPDESVRTLAIAIVLFGLLPLSTVPIAARGRDELVPTTRIGAFDRSTGLFREVDLSQDALRPNEVRGTAIYETRHVDLHWLSSMASAIGISNLLIIGVVIGRRRKGIGPRAPDVVASPPPRDAGPSGSG